MIDKATKETIASNDRLLFGLADLFGINRAKTISITIEVKKDSFPKVTAVFITGETVTKKMADIFKPNEKDD